MTPWTRSTAPFLTELASAAGGLMSGAGAPGTAPPASGNAASQSVQNKARGHTTRVTVNAGNDAPPRAGGRKRDDDDPAAAPDEGGYFDPALILAVMVFVLVLVAVVALLGR